MDAAIIDEHNRIRLLASEYAVNEVTIDKAEQYGSYVSLIPVTPVVSGVTTKGLLYSLDNAVIEQGNGLTVSNEIIEKTARIQIESGAVLIIESRD
jgi:thiamine pyrophosphokinase